MEDKLPPIPITPEQDAKLDKLADVMSYAKARSIMGIVPVERETTVIPVPEQLTQSELVTANSGPEIVNGTWDPFA